jgi:transposase, IS30 family
MEQIYQQLSEAERGEIWRLHFSGASGSHIGRVIGRNKSTVSRELTRNILPKGGYTPIVAQRMCLARRHRKRRCKIERSSLLYEAVHDGLLAMERTPEQIAGRLEHEHCKRMISTESIYRYIYSAEGRKHGLHKYLTRAKAKRGHRVRRGTKSLIPNRISIHERPHSIALREEFGHWECDLMAFSKPGFNNLVLTERKTRFILARRQNNKTAATITASIKSFQEPWKAQMFHSITYDNGCEFTNHGDVNGKAYFCDTHSPWQKGTVENTIGRLRRDLPRSIQKKDYSDHDFEDIIFMHNNKPRKCLGFRTPNEAFLIEFNTVALAL